MPPNENQALIARVFSGWVIDPRTWVVGGHNLETLLNACRLEERAKAEGEVEAWKAEAQRRFDRMREWMDASYHLKYAIDPVALETAADQVDCGGECETAWRECDTNASGCTKSETDGCPFELASDLRAFAKAEARMADLEKRISSFLATKPPEHIRRLERIADGAAIPWHPDLVSEFRLDLRAVLAALAVAEAALSRATQAEELVREVVGGLEFYADPNSWTEPEQVNRDEMFDTPVQADGYGDRARSLLAKLKAAPLQGDGSSSISSVESAARLASQVCDPTPPSSTGPETGWLIERADLEAGKTHYYFEPFARGQHGWTLDVHQSRRFPTQADAEAVIGLATGLRATEHVWVTLPADHTADDRPTEGSGVLSLAPDTEIPSASGSEQQ